MKRMILALSVFLIACAPTPPQTTVTPSARPGESPQPGPITQPTATPSPVNSTPPVSTDQIRAILTNGELTLQVNEELMLIGDVEFSSGKKITFDSVLELLNFENKNPELLSLDASSRLVKALKAGTATVVIASKTRPDLKAPITIQILAVPTGIDPNVALVDLEIQ